MQFWKVILAYDGTPFHGWQVQPGLPTVQGSLAEALHRLTGERVLPQGSGRTDTGVHALGQVASFALESPIPGPNLHRALNRMLPPSIRIQTVEPVSASFHARRSALRKTYEYRIFPSRAHGGLTFGSRESGPDRICSPMIARFVWDCPWVLDLAHLREAAMYVEGTHDFTSFAAVDPERAGSTLPVTADRTIFESSWEISGDLLLYRVSGTGFLHHMVRNLVGTFVDVGCGRLPATRIPEILAERDRGAAGPTAPARGLFLVSVEYP